MHPSPYLLQAYKHNFHGNLRATITIFKKRFQKSLYCSITKTLTIRRRCINSDSYIQYFYCPSERASTNDKNATPFRNWVTKFFTKTLKPWRRHDRSIVQRLHSGASIGKNKGGHSPDKGGQDKPTVDHIDGHHQPEGTKKGTAGQTGHCAFLECRQFENLGAKSYRGFVSNKLCTRLI